jgi:hypothetical protein
MHASFKSGPAILGLLLVLAAVLLPRPAAAQLEDYDPSWYDPDAPHLRIAVVEDGVYAVGLDRLESAGLPASVDRSTLRLIENGREVPIEVRDDSVYFVGQRNRGTDELWAYAGRTRADRRAAQSSPYRSLYSDTTYYWMTWGGAEGRRYRPAAGPESTAPTTALPDTLHREADNRYYLGRSFQSGSPLYVPSEGYYWRRFQHNSAGTLSLETSLAVGRRQSTADSLELEVRFDAETSSCHRVQVQAELLQADASTAFETVGTVEWRGAARQDFVGRVAQDRVPAGGLDVRIRSVNETFSSSACPSPSSAPNYVLLDYVEARYTRTLEARGGAQHFRAPRAQVYTFGVSGYTSGTAVAYNPDAGRRFALSLSGGSGTFTDTTGAAGTSYWVVGPGGTKRPAAVLPDEPSNWAGLGNGADYVILTTSGLLPSARELADYRRTQSGYDVEIVRVQNVFDEFDYGRPTPIAIRRFVRRSQQWSEGAPRFLTIFGDAQYPIYTGDIDERRPPWNVPSFGYSPSDGWYAMQESGPTDWSESLAVGRIPVRSNEQGSQFVEKLRTYESASPAPWQKRALLLAGGTSRSEQQTLQDYSNLWGSIASDTLLAVAPGDTLRPRFGADTLRYYKQSTDALDATFQDSLSTAIARGAGWLNYFGHSGAQTWEIVTDPPSEFDNAGRLPVAVSLACRTGSFAGGRFEVKSAPSLGEQLVVGSVRGDGTLEPGAQNGSIAHWGSSALGNIRPSARLNTALTERVFADSMRVLGEAIRQAKAEIAEGFGTSSLYRRHLLQYGLIGDPATQLVLPDRTDPRLSTEQISLSPSAPTPSQPLNVAVRVQNLGLYPADSVGLRFAWERPDGSRAVRTRTLPPFPLRKNVEFEFDLDERALGTNTFRATVDPANEYAEVSEANNTATRTQVVFDTGLELLEPVRSGVAASTTPTLRFNVVRRSTQEASIEAELDTIPSFDSPARQTATLSVSGVEGTWEPAPLTEGETYFWRVRTAGSDGPSVWRQGSFTVRDGLDGTAWAQRGRLFQENAGDRLSWSNGAWRFDAFPIQVQAFSDRTGATTGPNGFTLNASRNYLYLAFGFGVLVLDGETGEVKAAESFPTYDLADRFEDPEIGDQQQAVDALRRFLDTNVASGDHVFVRTRHFAREGGGAIPSEVVSLFQNLGSSTSEPAAYSAAIDTIGYNHLWTLYARKGRPSASVEQVSPPSEAGEVKSLAYERTLDFSYPRGQTVTPAIGPASDWEALSWSVASSGPDSRLEVDVLARDSTVLIDGVEGLSSNEQPLDGIDAQAHPYVRLRATFVDSTRRVPPQLNRWRIAYTGVPEIVSDPTRLQAIPDTSKEGADYDVTLPVYNLGPVATSGPVRVRFELTDAQNRVVPLATDTLSALAPGDSAAAALELATDRYVGSNLLSATAESDGPPERYAYNNTALRNFYVEGDRTPPSVKVLFQGREIPPTFTNDLQDPALPFVTTAPTMEIVASDNNPNYSLADTSYFEVYLKPGAPQRGPSIPTLSEFRRVPFRPGLLELETESDRPDEARIVYTPDFSEAADSAESQTYTLKVEAEDAQGNALEPYQGSFRVQGEQVIEDLYPYPNPMSRHTTFAFRIRGGSRAPDDFRLRIYTLSGRLVREFTGSAVNDGRGLRAAGWNLLRWNGRDADGDRVATGVYLYRVRMKGEDGTWEGDVEKIAVIR